MSKIDGANLQIGESGTATQNCTVTANGDGSFTLARGNIGATTQDLLTIDANGVVGIGGGQGGLPIQTVRTVNGEVVSGSTITPNDDTIPQITEGNEFLSVTITPTDVNSVLEIETSMALAQSAGNVAVVIALHKNSDANAIAAMQTQAFSSTGYAPHSVLKHEIVAGATSAITFTVRVGAPSGNVHMNASSGGARRLGGVMNSYIKVTEVTP